VLIFKKFENFESSKPKMRRKNPKVIVTSTVSYHKISGTLHGLCSEGNGLLTDNL